MEIKLLRNQTSNIHTFAVRYEDSKEYLVNIVKQGDIKTVESVSHRGAELDETNEQENAIKSSILEAVELEILKNKTQSTPGNQENADSNDTDQNLFYNDLKKFKEKYPECYIECWTPEDYSLVQHEMKGEDGDVDYPEPNWSDELWATITDKLDHDFDANYGTNWDRLKYVINNLTTT